VGDPRKREDFAVQGLEGAQLCEEEVPLTMYGILAFSGPERQPSFFPLF
jgi:hypothetical protein